MNTVITWEAYKAGFHAGSNDEVDDDDVWISYGMWLRDRLEERKKRTEK